MLKLNKIYFFLLFLCACTPGSEKEDVEEPKVVQHKLHGAWSNSTERLELTNDSFKYIHSKGTSNEGAFSGKVIDIDYKKGFLACEIENASIQNNDVSVAFEGDYSIFYFNALESTTVEIDAPQGAVVSGIKNIHRQDDADRVYEVFEKE